MTSLPLPLPAHAERTLWSVALPLLSPPTAPRTQSWRPHAGQGVGGGGCRVGEEVLRGRGWGVGGMGGAATGVSEAAALTEGGWGVV